MGEVLQARIYNVVDRITYLAFDNGGYGILSNPENRYYEIGQLISVEWNGKMYGEYGIFVLKSPVLISDQEQAGAQPPSIDSWLQEVDITKTNVTKQQQEIEDYERRQREAEEAARQQREAEEVARQQREAEEAARRQREAEEAARQQREAEEAARQQREAEEAARQQREAEEAARRQREAEEAARRLREVEEAARQQREAEETARRKWEQEQMDSVDPEADKEFFRVFFDRNPGVVQGNDNKTIFKPKIVDEEEFFNNQIEGGGNETGDASNTVKGKSFGGWAEMKIGNDVPFKVHSEIQQLLQKYQKDLKGIRQRLESNKKNNTDHRDEKIKMLEDDLDSLRTRRDTFISGTNKSIDSIVGQYRKVIELVQDCKSQLSNAGALSDFQTASGLDSAINNIHRAIEIQNKRKQNYSTTMLIDFREEEKLCESKKKEVSEEFEMTNRRYEEEYQAGIKSLQNNYDRKIRQGFSIEDVNAYRNTIESSRLNAEHYTDLKTIPEYIYIGNMCFEIPRSGDDGLEDFCQLLYKNAPDTTMLTNSSLKVTIPYCQNYREGISLMIKYCVGQNDQIKRMIMPMVLKLFMTFPSGKLEATMIDPLGSGSSFPDVMKLAGARSERVVDTKVWCESSDIDLAISAFRRKVDDQTQAYGEDIESRLQREELKVLAITDFPKGFSQRALENLHSIVRNASQNGVIVLIWTDTTELETLRQKNSSLVGEIEQQMLVCTSGQDGRLYTDQNNGLYLEMDPMEDIIEYKDEIVYTLANEIDNYRQKIEKFSDLFRDDMENDNNWFRGENDKISIPLGIKGASTVMKLELGKGGGSTEHHALIAGMTGAGKTSLMHTLIVSAMLSYAPEDLQLYLVDFKEGIEFKQYTRYRLPNLRVVAVDSEREFGLYILRKLESELNNRAEIFSRNNVSDIIAYNEIASERMPRLLLIFDEVHELFRSNGRDTIAADSLSCIEKLVSQGRALGIHIILACQDFNNCAGLNAYFSHFAVRIVVKGDNQGAASILSSDNEGIETLQNRPAGSVVYNRMGGDKRANTFFQVSYLPEEERTKYLELLNNYYTQPVIAEQYKDYDQRTLLTNVEDDINNRFNQLISEGVDSICRLAKTKGRYGILLGQGFGKESTVIKEFSEYNGDNLLIVGRDEKRAMALFEYTMLSTLYDELCTSHDASNTLCYVIDQSDPELDIRKDTADLNYMAEIFSQIEIVETREIEKLINFMYDTVGGRVNDKVTKPEDHEQLFLMIFGLNRIRALRTANIQNGEQSLVKKLESILLYGPTVGVNCVVWTEKNNLNSVFVGDFTDRLFTQRIAYGLSPDEMEILVEEADPSSLQESTAVYFDINDKKNIRFRPYNLPAREWLADIADVYAGMTLGEE